MSRERPRSSSASVMLALSDPRLVSSLRDVSQSTSSLRKQEFDERVKRYYYQLTVGCGNLQCMHKLCASSSTVPRLTTEAAAIMAVQLANHPRPLFCMIPEQVDVEVKGFSLSPFQTPSHSRSSSEDSLVRHSRASSMSILEKQKSRSKLGLDESLHNAVDGLDLVNKRDKRLELSLEKLNKELLQVAIETYTNGDIEFLSNCIKSVFSSPESLQKSFEADNLFHLNIQDTKDAYQKLLSLEPKQVFAELLTNAQENPLLQQDYDTLLKQVCLVLGKVRGSTKEVFIHYFSTLEEAVFLEINTIFQGFLGHRVNPQTTNQDEPLIACVKTLSMLSLANEYPNQPKKVGIYHFYNQKLAEKLNFKLEYKHWKKTRNQSPVKDFSFFNYPFLLDPQSKARIMHIDTMVQMSFYYEGAQVNQAFVTRAQQMLDDPESSSKVQKELKTITNPFLISRKRGDLKKPLKIRFVGGGEEGMDQGGVQKEFFQDVLDQLLNPVYGLFHLDPETRFSWFNSDSLESSTMFELIGIIVGLALYNGVHLGTLAKGWDALLKMTGDIENVLGLDFTITVQSFGKTSLVELVENGQQIAVTSENKQRYIDRYMHYIANQSIQKQFDPFYKGFLSVVGGEPLKMCRPLELELLLCGHETQEFDFSQLESAAHWFWDIVHQMPLVSKKQLLNFVTSSDRIPLGGLQQLQFVIQRNGPDTDRLPTSLTCFGRLLLPEYSSKDKLQERLLTAIQNAHGFGLV
ncbi:hypothetical protein EDD86DRAFT_258264 [Gorgonomyces haynaldii]|nr:hypothetical protein EDD86DRAFT_258264 [Gorgonomyces haynaldii]